MENEMEMICFQMITNSGASRSAYMEAMNFSRVGNFIEAEAKIKEGEDYRLKAHEVHFNLLQRDSLQTEKAYPLLLIHAEDQLMMTEMLEILAKEMVETHKLLKSSQSNS